MGATGRTKLQKLRVGEISLVGRGANRKQYLVTKSEGAVGKTEQRVADMVRAHDPDHTKSARVLKAVMAPAPAADAAPAAPLSAECQQALKAIARIMMPFKDQITDAMMDKLQMQVGILPDEATDDDEPDDLDDDAPPDRVAMSAEQDPDDEPDDVDPDDDADGDGEPGDDEDGDGDGEPDDGDTDDGEGEDDDPGEDQDGEDDADPDDLGDPDQDAVNPDPEPHVAKSENKDWPPKRGKTKDADKEPEEAEDGEDQDEEGEEEMATPGKKKVKTTKTADRARAESDELTAVRKANADLLGRLDAMEKRIAKSEQETVEQALTRKVEAFSHVGIAKGDLVELFKSAPKDQAAKLERVFKSLNEQARVAKEFGGDLFGEMGSRLNHDADSAEGKLEALIAQAVQKSDGKTREQAAREVYRSPEGRKLRVEKMQAEQGRR